MTKYSYFMQIAKLTAELSKDTHTKVGAVIVKNNKILSIGYNGSPRSFPENHVPSEHSSQLINDKNTYMVHAELNAILNYDGHMKDFIGATIFTTLSPCVECTKALLQIGIRTMIYLNEYTKEQVQIAKLICNYMNADYTQYQEGGENGISIRNC